VAVLILAIWWLVAHNSGSGWVQALGDLAFGTLSIGILGPWVVLARAKVTVLSAPADAAVGLPVEVRLNASTRLRVRACEPFEGQGFIGPGGRDRLDEGRITVVPDHRGVHGTLVCEVATAAPFALQWWTRRIHLPLPSPLHVAPRRGRPLSLPRQPDEDGGENVERAHRDAGEPRGARQYRSGDSRRQVHWRATAHAGELMVQDLERPSAGLATVTVVLPRDPEAAERAAERALGTIAHLLEKGAPVLVATMERGGPVMAPVADRRGAGRRLARAVAAPGAALAP
jgi:uncharacterized protein (DUF58 family)